MSKKKSNKQKVTYYDDNSTVVDMEPVERARHRNYDSTPKRKSTFKEKWKTYWSAVKMMFLPMLMVLAVLGILYLVFRLAT